MDPERSLREKVERSVVRLLEARRGHRICILIRLEIFFNQFVTVFTIQVANKYLVVDLSNKQANLNFCAQEHNQVDQLYLLPNTTLSL